MKSRDASRSNNLSNAAAESNENIDGVQKARNPKRIKKGVPKALPAHYNGSEADSQFLSSQPSELG